MAKAYTILFTHSVLCENSLFDLYTMFDMRPILSQAQSLELICKGLQPCSPYYWRRPTGKSVENRAIIFCKCILYTKLFTRRLLHINVEYGTESKQKSNCYIMFWKFLCLINNKSNYKITMANTFVCYCTQIQTSYRIKL